MDDTSSTVAMSGVFGLVTVRGGDDYYRSKGRVVVGGACDILYMSTSCCFMRWRSSASLSEVLTVSMSVDRLLLKAGEGMKAKRTT